MRLVRLLLLTVLFGLSALPALHAQESGSPYAVTVPVPDTSEAQRDAAFATALGQVLTRVVGGQDLRSKDGYDAALKGSAGMVQKYQYQRSGTGIVLQVNFDPGAVNHLVSGLGLPKAGVKPPVLLLVQGSDGQLLDADSLTALAQAAAAQGYQVVYPTAGSSPDLAKVAAADPAALATISATYHTGLVLLGQLQGQAASWTLISGGQSQQWTGSGATEDAMMTAAAGTLAARIGEKLNVVGTSTSTGTLQVAGLDSALDYAKFLNLLHGDPLVREVTTTGAQDGRIDFAISADLPLPALAAHLAASGRLLQAQAQAGADISLRWLR